MSATTVDIPSVIRSWTSEEKQIALATILQDYVSERGAEPLPIMNDTETVGYLMPRLRVRECTLDDNSPYMIEVRRRVETWEDSMPIEEVTALHPQEDLSPRQPA